MCWTSRSQPAKRILNSSNYSFFMEGFFSNFPIPIANKKIASVPTKPESAVETFSFFIHGNVYSWRGACFQNFHPSPLSENPFIFATFSRPSGEEEAKGERKRARRREIPNPIHIKPSNRLLMKRLLIGITSLPAVGGDQIRPCFQDKRDRCRSDDGFSNTDDGMNPCHRRQCNF